MDDEEGMNDANETISPLGGPTPERYQSGSWARQLLERVAWWAHRVHRSGTLLDVGCGDGELLHLFGGNQSYGIDLNPTRLPLALKRGLKVSLADGCQLPYRDGCFETVVSMKVLEHVPMMEKMMKGINRVLMTGGHWIVSVPSVTLKARQQMYRQGSPVYCDEHEHFREFSGSEIPWFKHKFMPLSDFEAMFRKHGFEVWRQEGLYFQLPDAWLPGTSLKKLMETNLAHRICSFLPVIRRFPYWTILILRKVD